MLSIRVGSAVLCLIALSVFLTCLLLMHSLADYLSLTPTHSPIPSFCPPNLCLSLSLSRPLPTPLPHPLLPSFLSLYVLSTLCHRDFSPHDAFSVLSTVCAPQFPAQPLLLAAEESGLQSRGLVPGPIWPHADCPAYSLPSRAFPTSPSSPSQHFLLFLRSSPALPAMLRKEATRFPPNATCARCLLFIPLSCSCHLYHDHSRCLLFVSALYTALPAFFKQRRRWWRR